MRALIACGIFAVASVLSLTPANAGYRAGSLVGTCKAQCGVIGTGRTQQLKPNDQVCVSKCIATKKAAQH